MPPAAAQYCSLGHFSRHLEEKWIKSEINRETYDRWHKTYSTSIFDLNLEVGRLGTNQDRAFDILSKNVAMLSDMKYIYQKADILAKREFIKLVFDSNLYYEKGIYRTPTMVPIFFIKAQEMSVKGYLIYEKKG
jgi:site-specific DNA recombinase